VRILFNQAAKKPKSADFFCFWDVLFTTEKVSSAPAAPFQRRSSFDIIMFFALHEVTLI
jgi:hypothetical protein